MGNPKNRVFTCSDVSNVNERCHEFAAALPPELRETFVAIVRTYISKYWTDGLFQRLKDKTYAEIVAEFNESGDSQNVDTDKIVCEGEKDGVRFTLYEAPDEEEQEDGRRES